LGEKSFEEFLTNALLITIMLEKDIENLLAEHPEEFFPKFKLKLVGQQVKLGSYHADIVFENEFGDFVVIEVKRGILPREAIGQIIDYYGELKLAHPNKNVHLLLVANVIPKQRTVFLAEKLGIKFVEIPSSKIRTIAAKYSYCFLDSEKPELLKRYGDVAKKLDAQIRSGKAKVWIFQANPKKYDILNALADDLEVHTWTINQYKNHIRAGHVALIWMSGREAGIYAVADIISDPEFMIDSKESTKYWVFYEDKSQRKLRVKIKYAVKMINNPIMREELREIKELRNLSIFRQPQGTNFPVSNDEWKAISRLIRQRFT